MENTVKCCQSLSDETARNTDRHSTVASHREKAQRGNHYENLHLYGNSTNLLGNIHRNVEFQNVQGDVVVVMSAPSTPNFNVLSDLKIIQTTSDKFQESGGATGCSQSLIRFQESQVSSDESKSDAGSAKLHNEVDGAIPISASISQDASCDLWCSCRCHTATQIKTPTWMYKAAGLLFIRFQGVPYLGRQSCNERSCQRNSSSRARITYYFPSWMMSRRILFVGNWRPLEGPELLLKVPRVIGPSALVFWYAASGDLTGIKELFARRVASPDDVSAATGSSVLQCVVQKEQTEMVQTEMVQFLLDQNADPYMEDFNSISPSDIVWDKILCNDIDSISKSRLEYLFHDPDLLDKRCFSPLHKIVLGFSSIPLESQLQLSTSNIDDVDTNGRTAISWAAARGDLRALQTLLRYKANIHLADNFGMRPLHHAATAKTSTCLRPLLSAGASVDDIDMSGKCVLATACMKQNSVEYLEPLIESGADVDSCVHDGTHILHRAILRDNLQSMNLLLDRGARLESADSQEFTSAMWAICQNSHDVLPDLLDRGIRLDSKTNLGQNVLQFAATRADLRTMKILTSAELCGIDVYATSKGENFNANERFEGRLLEKRPKDEANKAALRAAWQTLWQKAIQQNSEVQEANELLSTRDTNESDTDHFFDAAETLTS